MQVQFQTGFNSQEYLIWERQQELRHEYVNGEVFAMTGASREHNLICVNIAAALHGQLRGRPCEVYNNDMRVKIDAAGAYTYPDIVAVCGRPLFEDADVDTLLNPILIIEILSKSTERYDRGAKFGYYRTLPSLQDYVLITQDAYRVEHYTRQDDKQWLLTDYQDLADTITFSSIGCSLSMRDAYERIDISLSIPSAKKSF